jgi:NitT/TauT family transport system substrate-binding protein
MNKKIVLAIFGVIIVVLGVVFALWLRTPKDYPGKMESITIGMDPTAANSLIHIAENQNYFTSNGLKVTIKNYASGLVAVNGMLNDEVDVATAAEFVVVGQALKKENVRALASIDKFLHIHLLGRRDRGVKSIPDLKGKRIGVTLKTAAEFYLGRFLELQGMNMRQVTLINVSPPQSVDALVNGDVDAVVAWQPNVRAIEDRLGSGVVKWGVQKGQAAYCMVIGRGEWVTKHPELIKRFSTALVQAENYAVGHPDEAKAIVQRRLSYDDSYMTTIQAEHQFSLLLDQSLITAMEDEARWMIKNKLTKEKNVPNFLDYIYEDGLKAVKPEAVNIIR